MSEEEFRSFLNKNGRSPETTIESIVSATSVAGTRLLFQHGGLFLPDDELEKISSKRRAEFVEAIHTIEAGGLFWHEKSRSYLGRRDFPKDRSSE